MSVLETVPGKLVLWRVVLGPQEWVGTQVRFELSEQDGYAIVLFSHTGWREPGEFLHHCSTKWATFLMSLKHLLESGVGEPAPRDVRISNWHGRIPWPMARPCSSTIEDVQFSVRRCVVRTMSYTESRAKYAEVLDAVVNDREEVVITRAGHEPAVIVSLDDYESLKETAYLLRSPANARRLLASIDELESGKGVERELME